MENIIGIIGIEIGLLEEVFGSIVRQEMTEMRDEIKQTLISKQELLLQEERLYTDLRAQKPLRMVQPRRMIASLHDCRNFCRELYRVSLQNFTSSVFKNNYCWYYYTSHRLATEFRKQGHSWNLIDWIGQKRYI
jgi:hypothetical protein